MIEIVAEIRPLLAEVRMNALGPGVPNLAAKALLQELEGKLPKIARNRDFALACLAGLWLYHDFLDESHAVSQDLDTVEGRYWHGIMHRRELDYENSKYWFRRVPGHAIFAELNEAVRLLTKDAGVMPGSEILLHEKAWNPAGFVDLCELAVEGPPGLPHLCRQIQHREWEHLFNFCYKRAFS